MYLPVLACGSLATGKKNIKMPLRRLPVAHSGKPEKRTNADLQTEGWFFYTQNQGGKAELCTLTT